jgi:hypothetical protein
MRTTKQASTIMLLRHMATKVKPTVATNADQLQQDGVLVKLGPGRLADYMPTALVEPRPWQHLHIHRKMAATLMGMGSLDLPGGSGLSTHRVSEWAGWIPWYGGCRLQCNTI